VPTWDATEAARKALSCVFRTGQRFGVNYLIEVLHGVRTERIESFGHDKLSTFGIGLELEVAQWRGVFRQLVALGLLDVDIEGFGGLQLNDSCRPVLRGEQQLLLRQEIKRPRQKAKARREQHQFASEADVKLWEALREKRRELARDQGVPPYVIFNDTTLREIVEHRPDTLEQFRLMHGVGEVKLAQYGEEFIMVVREAG
jgi:ATP-dependent DNA helicase RecQ